MFYTLINAKRKPQIIILLTLLGFVYSLHEKVQHTKINTFKFSDLDHSTLLINAMGVGESNEIIKNWTVFWANSSSTKISPQFNNNKFQIEICQNVKTGFKAMIVGYPQFMVLSYRYTKGLLNMLTDVSSTFVTDITYTNENIKVHQGFQLLWNTGKDCIKIGLNQMKNNLNLSKLYITGYSLGGALAQLSYFQIKNAINFQQIQIVTFGSPRVGNKEWSSKFQVETNGKSIRYASKNDPIQNLPAYQIIQNIEGLDTSDPSQMIQLDYIGKFSKILNKLFNGDKQVYLHAGSRYLFDSQALKVTNQGHFDKVDKQIKVSDLKRSFSQSMSNFFRGFYTPKDKLFQQDCGYIKRLSHRFPIFSQGYSLRVHVCAYPKLFNSIVNIN